MESTTAVIRKCKITTMHDDTNEHKRYYMGSHVLFNNKEIDRTRELAIVCTLPNEEMSKSSSLH